MYSYKQVDKNKLLKIVDGFDKIRVLVIGDLILDEYIFGDTTRLSPEAPIPIVEVRQTMQVLGGAANAANNIKALGCNVIISGVIGKDPEGRSFLRLIKKNGLSPEGIIVDPERPTTRKTRIISQGQQVVRIDREINTPISPGTELKIIGWARKALKWADIVLISDYNKGAISYKVCQDIIAAGKRSGKLVIADPKGNDYTKYKLCSIITPNLNELEIATRTKIANQERLAIEARKLLRELQLDNVLATLGGKGMCLFTSSGKIIKVPAANTPVVDISGAGDTAIAVLAISLASKTSLEEAMIMATYACSVVIGKVGTATLSPGELKKAIAEIKIGPENKNGLSHKN